MRPVSEQFVSAVRSSHKMVTRAWVVTDHQTGVEPVGVEIPILDGNVVHDGDASIRASLDLTTDASWWPYRETDLLVPYGNEIFVTRGIEYGDRDTETVSQGYFRIDSVDQGDAPIGEISITATDRMSGIVDGRLPAPKQFLPGTTYEEIFEELIWEIYPGAPIEFDFDASAVVLIRSVVVEEDRYAFLADMATARAKDFYVDYRGVFVIKSRPNPAQSVFDVNAGEGGVLVSLNREISRDGVYNGVVATGEGADTVEPVRALVVNDSPNSPTRWGGRFGRVPMFYSSPFITTTNQARSAGAKILSDQLGLPYRVDFNVVPNPALEPYDPVRINNGRTNNIHILRTVTVPLTAGGAMEATTREQTFASIGAA